MFPKRLPEPPQLKEHPPSLDSSDGDDDIETLIPIRVKAKERSASGQLSQHSKYGSKGALHSPAGSMHSFDLQVFINISNQSIEFIYPLTMHIISFNHNISRIDFDLYFDLCLRRKERKHERIEIERE